MEAEVELGGEVPGMQLPRSSHMMGWVVSGYTNTFVSPMSLSVMPTSSLASMDRYSMEMNSTRYLMEQTYSKGGWAGWLNG